MWATPVCFWDLKGKHEPASTEENVFTARSWPRSLNKTHVWQPAALLSALQFAGGRGLPKEETKEEGWLSQGKGSLHQTPGSEQTQSFAPDILGPN